MKVIPPHKTVSKKVESYGQIKKDVEEMRLMVNGTFKLGLYPRAFALSHAQVSNEPFRFYVLNKEQMIEGHDVIINPFIYERYGSFQFKEACMSFPFRPSKKMNRYQAIVLEFYYKTLFGLKKKEIYLEGIDAIIAQHEVDHANGICIY